MGEIHKKSLEGVKLEGGCKEYSTILSIFFGFWFVLYVGLQQKDEGVKSAVIKVAVCQLLCGPLCCTGLIWAIYWAKQAKAQS